LALSIILGSICAVAGAQIDANETGLHDGATVYGLDAPLTPVPYVNLDAITLFAWGETDPNLYTDVSFNAFGLLVDVNLVNSGAIAVAATGGMAAATGASTPAEANNVAYGVYSTYGLITNSGRINVMSLGGTASSEATSFTMRETSAAADAYGVYAEDGAINNTADVNVVATGGTATGAETNNTNEVTAGAWASGLYLYGSAGLVFTYPDRRIDNTGDIVVTATAGNAEGAGDDIGAVAWAYGITAIDGAPVVNSGDIMVTATGGDALCTSTDTSDDSGAYAGATAKGIQSDSADLDNSGSMTVSAMAGTATSEGIREASARADVGGVQASGDSMESLFVDVQNTGSIIATATAGAATSESGAARAYATAYGLSTSYAGVGNTGTISVVSHGGSAESEDQAQAYATAFGLSASHDLLNNDGDVAVSALSGTADGQIATAYAQAFGLQLADVDANNTGDVMVIARGGDVTAGEGGNVMASASGITVDHSNLINRGDITVTAESGESEGDATAGAYAQGIDTYLSNVNNSGDITVTATAGEGVDSEAYGIRFHGDGTLTNTGIIRATGDTAYEVRVTGSTTLTLVDVYNVTLDGDPNDASIFVGDDATVALNDATLTVTAVNETQWNTPYRLFETAGTGAVDGNFADVRAMNPNTTVTYDDQGTAGSADDTVALAYTPVASTAGVSAAVEKQAIDQATDVVNFHMTNVLLQNILSPSPSGLLANDGSAAESLALSDSANDKSAGVFIEPYYSRLNKDANPMGFRAGLWGFAAGYERFIENTLLGLHLGYGRSNIDYTGAGFRGNSEDQDIVTAGFNGLTRWDPWLLHYGLTGFYGSHDYEGLTGLALDERETASYDSYGAAAMLMGGRIFRVRSHVLLPEAGLNWIWAHRQRYTTEATDPAWDATYSAMNDHDLYAAAAVRWLNSFLHGDTRVSPSIAVGIRHLLTDAETNAWQSVPGIAPVLVKSEQDRTALTPSGSLTLSRTEHALSLAYDGEYSPDAQRHNVWLRYSWLF